MKTYLVCSTFRGSSSFYKGLFDKMRSIGAVSAIGGTWVLNSMQSSEDLQMMIFALLHPSDQLLVCELQSNWASIGLSRLIEAILPS